MVASLLEANGNLSVQPIQDTAVLNRVALKITPGVVSWKVPYYEGRGKNLKEAKWFTSHEGVQAANSKNPKFSELLSALPRTLFHPVYTSHNTKPVSVLKDPLNLLNCARIYPQLMNTGGFFVSVLQKG